jgi:hypothetical protein
VQEKEERNEVERKGMRGAVECVVCVVRCNEKNKEERMRREQARSIEGRER